MPPPRKFTPKDQNLCNLRLSGGHFYGSKVNLFVLTTTNWNHLSDDQVKALTLHDFKRLIARMLPQAPSDSSAHSPLVNLNWRLDPVTYEIKIKNCNIMKPHADAFQASLSPHRLSLPGQLVFFCKMTFIILKSMSLFEVAQQFVFLKFLTTCTNSFECPTRLLCLWLTRPVRLLFTDTHSHLLTQLQSSNFLPLFSARVTNVVNVSLLEVAFSQLNHGVEACRNDGVEA